MISKILTPLEAADAPKDDALFYTNYPLREWGVIKKIKQMADDGVAGSLCSLRFTWQRPKKQAEAESIFLYQTMAWLLDAACFLADAPIVSLHIERIAKANNLFAIAMLSNDVALEIEANECLPDTMPSTYFIKANFSHGHLTNQPIAGHFNADGSVFADDSGMRQWVIENTDWSEIHDEIELCRRSMALAIEGGSFPAGPLNSHHIIQALKEALA